MVQASTLTGIKPPTRITTCTLSTGTVVVGGGGVVAVAIQVHVVQAVTKLFGKSVFLVG